jgi:hypothetical protein
MPSNWKMKDSLSVGHYWYSCVKAKPISSIVKSLAHASEISALKYALSEHWLFIYFSVGMTLMSRFLI